MKIQPQSKLLMIGDSITDCGRDYGAKGEKALGNGYVRFVNETLKEEYPGFGIEILNKGISGNTILDLKRRWQRDVLNHAPDWLSILIGINDVWQQYDGWMPERNWVKIDEYERTYDELLKKTVPSLKGLILMTPYFLQLDKKHPMRIQMDEYSEVVRHYAQKYDAILVDTQAAFDAAMQNLDVNEFSNDRIHMNDRGHQILAAAFIKAVK